MKPIGGMGGVKLEITIGETIKSVEFSPDKAYMSQASVSPVKERISTYKTDTVQSVYGQKLRFTGFFDNVTIGDEDKINLLLEIIQLSQKNGIPITLWPKHNVHVPDSISYQVLAMGMIPIKDISTKAQVAERLSDIAFVTQEPVADLPYFLEGRFIPVIGTHDGQIIVFGTNIIEIPIEPDLLP